MKKQILFFLSVVLLSFSTPIWAGKIIAVVNEDVITEKDLNDRMNVIIKSSNLKNEKEMRKKLRENILNILVSESLKKQAATELELFVNEEEVEKMFTNLAASNKKTTKQFTTLLKQTGINKTTILNQLKADIAWKKAIEKKFIRKITISDTEVKALENELKALVGQEQYRLFEIFIPFSAGVNKSRVVELAKELSIQIGQGANFQTIAQQFSHSDSAPIGGDLGWISVDSLDKRTKDVLQKLSLGEVSYPVETKVGCYIYWLQDWRQLTENELKMPTESQLKQKIFTNKIMQKSKQYLNQLKQTSYIDIRE